PAGANFMIINLYSSSNPSFSEIQVEQGAIATAYEAGYSGLMVFFDKDRIIPPVGGIEPASGLCSLTLNSSGDSEISGVLNGDAIKRTVRPYPAGGLRDYPVFNFQSD